MFWFLVALLAFLRLYGSYPWGSDTWGHLFKVEVLYRNLLVGNFYPQYMEDWYNGIQVFRYWAPLPYYLLVVFRFFTSDPGMIFWLFIVTYFITATGTWFLFLPRWGWRLCLLTGTLYATFADNLRVLFSEGNIPRMMVAAEFPIMLYLAVQIWEGRSRKAGLWLALTAGIMVLSHAMIAALVMVVLFLVTLFYSWFIRQPRLLIDITWPLLLGIGLAGWWFLPSLVGGITSINKQAVIEYLQENFFYSIKTMFNPWLRWQNREGFYYSLSLLALLILFFVRFRRSSPLERAVGLVIFLLTVTFTRAFSNIYVKLPLANLLWSFRFLPFVGGLGCWLLASYWQGRKIRGIAAVFLLSLFFYDFYQSSRVLLVGREYPANLEQAFAGVTPGRRIALLDLSELGSFPSYYLSTGAGMRQVYGWAWQGAKTSTNIMLLNTALEKGWYLYLFDRCLQLGSHYVAIKTDKIKDWSALMTAAKTSGYSLQNANPIVLIFRGPESGEFATRTRFRGLAIGSYGANAVLMFPALQLGRSIYLDDYSLQELLSYDPIIFSGFQYRERAAAEKLVTELSRRGKKVIVDLTNSASELFSGRTRFLGVMAERIAFVRQFPAFNWQNRLLSPQDIPENYPEWGTHYLLNTDQTLAVMPFGGINLTMVGQKAGVTFIGGNLFFLAFLTHNPDYLELLETITGLKTELLPERQVVALETEVTAQGIRVKVSDRGTLLLPLANLDVFQRQEETENLLTFTTAGRPVELKWQEGKVFRWGKAVSLISFCCWCCWAGWSCFPGWQRLIRQMGYSLTGRAMRE